MNWEFLFKGGLGLSTCIALIWIGWKLRRLVEGNNELSEARAHTKQIIDFTKLLQKQHFENAQMLSKISTDRLTVDTVSSMLSSNGASDPKAGSSSDGKSDS